MMVECTIYLKAEIQEWAYSRELKKSSSGNDEIIRMLRLDSEVEFAGLIDRQALQCTVNSGTDSYSEPAEVLGCLMLNEELADEGVPANASFELTLSELEFDDLKKCLMQSMVNSQMQVRLGLTLQGVQTESANQHDGTWLHGNVYRPIEGRSLEITGFHWELAAGALKYEKVANNSTRPLRLVKGTEEEQK